MDCGTEINDSSNLVVCEEVCYYFSKWFNFWLGDGKKVIWMKNLSFIRDRNIKETWGWSLLTLATTKHKTRNHSQNHIIMESSKHKQTKKGYEQNGYEKKKHPKRPSKRTNGQYIATVLSNSVLIKDKHFQPFWSLSGQVQLESL